MLNLQSNVENKKYLLITKQITQLIEGEKNNSEKLFSVQ